VCRDSSKTRWRHNLRSKQYAKGVPFVSMLAHMFVILSADGVRAPCIRNVSQSGKTVKLLGCAGYWFDRILIDATMDTTYRCSSCHILEPIKPLGLKIEPSLPNAPPTLLVKSNQ
jgi:hypothetical protein